VRKLNANDYTTSMSGLKFKIAHKRAESEKWSASPEAQRRRMIKFLQDVVEDLKKQDAQELEGAGKPKTKRASEQSKAKSKQRIAA